VKFSFSKQALFAPQVMGVASGLLLIPLIVSLCFLQKKNLEVSRLCDRVAFLEKKKSLKRQTHFKEKELLAKIRKSRPDYIKETVGKLSFLGPQQQKWKMFLAQTESSQSVKEKYAFLDSIDNNLRFEEVSSGKNSLFEEKELSQKKGVRINGDDLKVLLSSLEGIKIGSHLPPDGAPQIVITGFSLEKNIFPELQEKTYIVSMNLLTRQRVSP